MQKVYKLLFGLSIFVIIICIAMIVLCIVDNKGFDIKESFYHYCIIPVIFCFGTLIYASKHIDKK